MKLSNYENAIAKHYNSLSLNSFPLTCWDFYSKSFDKFRLTLSDANLLNRIVKDNKWNTTWDYKEELTSDTVIVVTGTIVNSFCFQKYGRNERLHSK
jgi:hypothetical protein